MKSEEFALLLNITGDDIEARLDRLASDDQKELFLNKVIHIAAILMNEVRPGSMEGILGLNVGAQNGA